MQEVSTTNEQKQCNNPETSNAIARGNTVHTDCHLKGYRACSLSFFIASWLLAVQTVGRAYAYSGKKLILVYFYLYICHWILDISIIYSEISASKYHGIHVDYIDELQHDFISPACSSMKPVNCVYSLILNPLSLIFLSDYPVSGCLVKMPMNFSQIFNTYLFSAQAGVPGYV